MLKNCWEIKQCGREEGGAKADELGVCPAYPDHGHSCWVIAGTFCKGEVQGSFAQKHGGCAICELYQMYSTTFGHHKEDFRREHPEEFKQCEDCLKQLCSDKDNSE